MDDEVQGTPGWSLPPLRTGKRLRCYVGKRTVAEIMASSMDEEIGVSNTQYTEGGLEADSFTSPSHYP